MGDKTRPEVDFLKEAARSYGKMLADEFDHEPTVEELKKLNDRAEKEFGLAYLNEAITVFDQIMEKRFPQKSL